MKTSKTNHKASNIGHTGARQRGTDDQKHLCDICTQLIPGPERDKVFAFGKCDHYICYVCSARLRALCDQQDCPICREKLETVIFSSSSDITFAKCNLKSFIFNEKYKIYFESNDIYRAFNKLLRYECLECNKNLKSSNQKAVKIPNNNEKISSPLDNKSKEANQVQGDAPNNTNKDNKPRQIKKGISKSPTSQKNRARESSIGKNNYNTTTTAQDSRPSSKPPPHNSNDEDVEYNKEVSAENADPNPTKHSLTDDKKTHDFSDVNSLKRHLFNTHKLKLCDHCLKHNKLFPFEYSYYDQASLRNHVEKGEPKTSHRGHPTCKLCKETYFNLDELLFHMNRDHYHCHLCERTNSSALLYFSDYPSLRDHFKQKHILCERDNCRHEQFTSAFENRIDYQLHLVQVHENHAGGHLPRGVSRQQRTITLDPTSHRAREVSPQSMHQNLPRNATIVTTGITAMANRDQIIERNPDVLRFARQQLQLRQSQPIPTRSEFPALGQNVTTRPEASSGSPVPSSSSSSSNFPVLSQQRPQARSQQTPAPSTSKPPPNEQTTATLSQRIAAGPSGSNSFVRTLGGGRRPPDQLDETNFPPLPEQPKPKNANKKNSNKKTNVANGEMSLDQQIRAMWVSSSRAESKGNKNKSNPNKKAKQKPLKIQLS